MRSSFSSSGYLQPLLFFSVSNLGIICWPIYPQRSQHSSLRCYSYWATNLKKKSNTTKSLRKLLHVVYGKQHDELNAAKQPSLWSQTEKGLKYIPDSHSKQNWFLERPNSFQFFIVPQLESCQNKPEIAYWAHKPLSKFNRRAVLGTWWRLIWSSGRVVVGPINVNWDFPNVFNSPK